MMAPMGLLLEIMSAMAGSTPMLRAVVLGAGGRAEAVAGWKDLVAGTTKAEVMPTKATTERINRRNLVMVMVVVRSSSCWISQS